MAKTTFSSGVIVTSQWLNGAQQIYFDGQDLDWHYPPLGLNSFVRTGPNGLNSAYVTLDTDQPTVNANGDYISGLSISGAKVVTGPWFFGYDSTVATNPANVDANAPKSFTTNDKYNNAGGVVSPTVAQKFAALDAADIVTKEILEEWTQLLTTSLTVDNGVYASSSSPACENYDGGSTTICPL